MKKYHKIDTLFARDENHKVEQTRLRNPVIGTISSWVVTEKIDGTNIRISLTPDNKIKVAGRSDNAQIHPELYEHIFETFTVDKLKELRQDEDPTEITLYGEGYGAGIQKGGGYREDKSFILFDVRINDTWWMDDGTVTKIAEKLDIPRVPVLGHMGLSEIVSCVKGGFPSHVALEREKMAEGIVARPTFPLYDHHLNRLIIKLKTKDFV